MSAQGKVGARPLREEPPDHESAPADNRVDDGPIEYGTSRCGDGGRPPLWERLLHNLMLTLGAWTI